MVTSIASNVLTYAFFGSQIAATIISGFVNNSERTAKAVLRHQKIDNLSKKIDDFIKSSKSFENLAFYLSLVSLAFAAFNLTSIVLATSMPLIISLVALSVSFFAISKIAQNKRINKNYLDILSIAKDVYTVKDATLSNNVVEFFKIIKDANKGNKNYQSEVDIYDKFMKKLHSAKDGKAEERIYLIMNATLQELDNANKEKVQTILKLFIDFAKINDREITSQDLLQVAFLSLAN
jgi:hypothetical protein